MKSILARANVSVLEELARRPSLLAFDFDGTLAPIVTRHEEAAMRPSTAELFRELCALYPCIVVSGRSRADVASRVPASRLRAVIGNHGLELDERAPRPDRAIVRARTSLTKTIATLRGVELEDKVQSLAIHYRAARSPDIDRLLIRAVRALRLPVRIVEGKRTVNIVPRGGAHKGDVVRRLAAKMRAEATLFVGDDVTDEDVFAVPHLVSVRVGRSASSRARYFVPGQADVDRLLATLVRLRAHVLAVGYVMPTAMRNAT